MWFLVPVVATLAVLMVLLVIDGRRCGRGTSASRSSCSSRTSAASSITWC